MHYRVGAKIQGLRRVATEDFLPFAIGKIELHYLVHRIEITHPHRIVRADHDPVRADDLN